MEENENKEVIEVEKLENQEKTTEAKKDTNKKGFCIASMVLGIISLVFCCAWIISIPCGILAIIFGILGIKSMQKGMAIAGLITASIGLIISFIIFMALVLFGVATGITESLDSYDYHQNTTHRSWYDDEDTF